MSWTQHINREVRYLRLMVIFVCMATICHAQNPTDDDPMDPGAISVTTIQNMSFGAFTTGASGGTIIISSSGSRSVTGTVIPLNVGILHFEAIFEVDAPQGSIISIINGPDATLSGSNGGSMTVHIGNSNPASPFSVTEPQPAKTEVHVGGTLNVGNSVTSPPGSYSGMIYITFNQE